MRRISLLTHLSAMISNNPLSSCEERELQGDMFLLSRSASSSFPNSTDHTLFSFQRSTEALGACEELPRTNLCRISR